MTLSRDRKSPDEGQLLSALVAGAALFTGVTGNALFAVLGLLTSLPLLRRLHRRFDTWRAPAVALAAFAVMFSLSAFVIGPAISAGTDVSNSSDPAVEPSHSDEHHEQRDAAPDPARLAVDTIRW